MTALRPRDLALLRALDESHRTLMLPEHRYPHEILDQPEHMVERRLERLMDQGYAECGVSTRTGWLTEKGRVAIAKDVTP